MTTDPNRWLLGDYVEQEIRERFDDNESLPSEDAIQRSTLTIARYVDDIICDQITNAFF